MEVPNMAIRLPWPSPPQARKAKLSSHVFFRRRPGGTRAVGGAAARHRRARVDRHRREATRRHRQPDRTTARRVAASGVDRAPQSASAVHPGGMRLPGRIYWEVLLGSLSGFPQWAARPGSVHTHPSGRDGNFQPCAAAVAADERCGADNAGICGFLTSGSALLAYGTGRPVRRVREKRLPSQIVGTRAY
jgi:hypothetical protein